MSDTEDNYEVFKDCLSSTFLQKYSAAPPKKTAKRPRKSARSAGCSIGSGSEDGGTDAAELADFIEVIPNFTPKHTSQLSRI